MLRDLTPEEHVQLEAMFERVNAKMHKAVDMALMQSKEAHTLMREALKEEAEYKEREHIVPTLAGFRKEV